MLLGSGNLSGAVIGWGKHRHIDIHTEKLGSGGPCMPLWSRSSYTGTWHFSINYAQRRGVWCGPLTSIPRWAFSGYKHLGGGICGCQCLHTLLIFAFGPKEGFAILLSLTWGIWKCSCARVCVCLPISHVSEAPGFGCSHINSTHTQDFIYSLYIHSRLLLLPHFPSYILFQKSHPQ